MTVYQTNDLAGGITELGTHEPLQLFAGEMPVFTDHGTAESGTTLAKYTVVQRDSDGFLIAWNGTDGVIVGITAQPVAAVGANVDVPIFTGGFFNHEVLVWPAAVDTLAERRAAFASLQTIRVGRLL
jgi:hypothetical protein